MCSEFLSDRPLGLGLQTCLGYQFHWWATMPCRETKQVNWNWNALAMASYHARPVSLAALCSFLVLYVLCCNRRIDGSSMRFVARGMGLCCSFFHRCSRYSLRPKKTVVRWLLEITFDCSSYSTFFTIIIIFVMTYYITNDILIIFYLSYNLHKKIWIKRAVTYNF